MLRLRAFGSVALYDGETVLEGPFTQRRRLALLAMLAAAGDRGVSRDTIISRLWPESDADRARHALRQWIFLLRRDLGGEDVISGSEELRLNRQHLGSDVGDFARALSEGEDERAIALYAGSFMDGFHLTDAGEYERWLDGERDLFATQFRAALERVAAARAAAGDAPGAADAWRRLAAADPLNSRVARCLMEALETAGDRSGALAHARVHASLVREDLGSDPDPAVVALAERIRNSPLRVAGANSFGAAAAVTSPVRPRESSLGAPDAASLEVSDSVPSRAPSGRRRVGLWLVALPLVAGILISAVRSLPSDRRASLMTLLTREAPTLQPHRIVVAPLENRTGDSSLTAFGEMAADWIAQALVAAGDFEVVDVSTSVLSARIVGRIPRVFRAGDRAVALAEETGAGSVITGRYYRDGDSLHVQVQLINVPARRISWSTGLVTAHISGGGASAAAVEVLSRRVVAMIAAQMDTSASAQPIAVTTPPSFEAYRETSRAWERYYAADLPQFFAHARMAVAIDSTYMLPIVMQAHVLSEMRDWTAVDSLVGILRAHRSRLVPLEDAALELAEAQLRGDLGGQLRAAQAVAHAAPGSAETRTYLAHMAVNVSRPHTALAALAEVDPHRGAMLVNPWYWNWITAALHESGDHARELALAKRGLRQFPGHPAAMLNVGRALAATGDFAALQDLVNDLPSGTERQEWFRRKMLLDWSRELDAHDHSSAARTLAQTLLDGIPARDSEPETLRVRISALMLMGNWTSARDIAARLFARTPRDLTSHGMIGVIAAALGDRVTAERMDAALEHWSEPYAFGRPALWRARIAATFNERERAIALVEEAMSEGHPRFFDPAGGPFDEPEYHIDPALRSLRGHARFRNLLAPRE